MAKYIMYHMLAAALLLALAANYSASRSVVDGVEVLRLADAARDVEVSILPSAGNIAYELKVRGQNLLWFPFPGPAAFKSRPAPCGIPFLAPWANRLSGDAWWANGRKYLLNPDLGNLRRDQNGKPIHGLLYFSPHWRVVALEAGPDSARAVSRLEFWRYPDLMAQFPFAHTLTMTYRLAAGVLEVETEIENHSLSPMPVSVGYHPFFRLHDSPRDDWMVHLAAREQVLLDKTLIPTGERAPLAFSDPQRVGAAPLDSVFMNLVRGGDGRASFWVRGKAQQITVSFGPNYRVAVVYAPPGRDFICIEPMAAITDAFNLAHAGLYAELQTIPPGGRWKESFWITAATELFGPLGF